MKLFNDGSHVIENYFDDFHLDSKDELAPIDSRISSSNEFSTENSNDFNDKKGWLDGSLSFYRHGSVVNFDDTLSAQVYSNSEFFCDLSRFGESQHVRVFGNEGSFIQIIDNNLGNSLTDHKNIQWVLASENYLKDKKIYKGINISHLDEWKEHVVRVVDFVRDEEPSSSKM